MAFRDTWHRTLVYFGLAEDAAYDEDVDRYPEPEDQMQDSYRSPRTVRRLETSSRRSRHSDFDDIFDDGYEEGRTTKLRAVAGSAHGKTGADVRVHFVAPKNFNDAQDVADRFKDQIPVILNLQGADTDLAKRLIDFSSGLTYALNGGMERVADKVFMLSPKNVTVSADERAQLLEKGFFNQS